MNTNLSDTRPLLKTKAFSTLYIEMFEHILLGKTNREINLMFGYTLKSHVVVDHSRQVMHKLLSLESLSKRDYLQEVIYPRKYQFWWKKLLDKHMAELLIKAIQPQFYENRTRLL
jgi:hypothetical protein